MGRRSGSRYLAILRGKRGTPAAKTRLLSYLAGDIDVSYPERQGNRPARNDVWVRPFALPLAADKKLQQFITSGESVATYLEFAEGFVSTVAPAEADRIAIPQLLAPRAAITTGRSTSTGTEKTSKLTGLKYRSYGGNTVSVPFGEGTAATEKDEDSVFRAIRAKVKENPVNTCSFVPGSYSV